jgi:hypothetical protein
MCVCACVRALVFLCVCGVGVWVRAFVPSGAAVVSGGADRRMLLWQRDAPAARPHALAGWSAKVNAVHVWDQAVAVAGTVPTIAVLPLERG